MGNKHSTPRPPAPKGCSHARQTASTASYPGPACPSEGGGFMPYLGVEGWSNSCYATGGAWDQTACDETFGCGVTAPVTSKGCGIGARIFCVEKNGYQKADAWGCCWGTDKFKEPGATGSVNNRCRRCWKPGFSGCEDYKQSECEASWQSRPNECLWQKYQCCTGRLSGTTVGKCSARWTPNSPDCVKFIEDIANGRFKGHKVKGIDFSPGGGTIADNMVSCCRKASGYNSSDPSKCLKKWSEGSSICDSAVTPYCQAKVKAAGGSWSKIRNPPDGGLDCSCFTDSSFSPPLISGTGSPAACVDSRCSGAKAYHTGADKTTMQHCPDVVSCNVFFNTTAGGRVEFKDVTINQRCRSQKVGGICRYNTDCGTGSSCSGSNGGSKTGLCTKTPKPQCTVEADCPAGKICGGGKCINPPPMPDCKVTGDCPPGHACDPSTGHCIEQDIPVQPSSGCKRDSDCMQGGEWCIKKQCKRPTLSDRGDRYWNEAKSEIKGHKAMAAGVGVGALGLLLLMN